jgi:hypothetical protein
MGDRDAKVPSRTMSVMFAGPSTTRVPLFVFETARMRPTPRLLANKIFPGRSSPTLGAEPLIVHTNPFELTDFTELAPPTNTTLGW